MNREIKFRAWNESLEEMIFLKNSGLQYFDFEGSYSLGFTVDGYSGFWAHEQYESASKKANNFPIMQFTGLTDTKGKEIYEGDITDEGLVIWHNEYLGFFVETKENDEDFKPLYDCVLLEVIGNIYETPELLKSEIKSN